MTQDEMARFVILGSGLELSVFSHHTQNESRLAETSKGHEEAGERGCPLSPLMAFSFVLVIDGCRVYTYPKEEGRFIRP